MSTLRRACAVLVSAGLAVPLWAVPSALAATTEEAATDGAYFSSTGIAKPDQSPQAPPNVTAEADGVAPGNLAVAARGGSEDKVSFLRFPLADVPLDAVISKAVLTVPLAPDGDGNVSLAPDPVKVRACKAGDTGFSGDDGAALSLAPERLCEDFAAPAKATDDGAAYTFDITGLAATWLEANDGVALTAAEGAETAPFQVVFAAAPEATLAYELSAAPVSEPVAPLPEVPSTGSGVSGDAGSFSGGFSGGDTSVDSGGFGSVDAPAVAPADVPVPQTMDAPTPEVAPAQVRNVAFAEPSITPSTSFWLGLLALAAVLAGLSLILGDPRVAAPAAARPSRLARALQEREQAAVSGRRPLGRPVHI